MKNWEKYEKEIKEIGISYLAVVDGKPVTCGGLACEECDLQRKRNNNASCHKTRDKWLYQDDEIKSGDIIYRPEDPESLVYVTIDNNITFSGFGIGEENKGGTYYGCIKEEYVKTNKHIPLDKVIEFIGGDQ